MTPDRGPILCAWITETRESRVDRGRRPHTTCSRLLGGPTRTRSPWRAEALRTNRELRHSRRRARVGARKERRGPGPSMGAAGSNRLLRRRRPGGLTTSPSTGLAADRSRPASPCQLPEGVGVRDGGAVGSECKPSAFLSAAVSKTSYAVAWGISPFSGPTSSMIFTKS